MKKLIYEAMTVALVISFTGNTFAANGRSSNRATQPALLAPASPATPVVTVEPKPLFERILNWAGYPTPETKTQTPPPIVIAPTRAKVRPAGYGATAIPEEKQKLDIESRNRMNARIRKMQQAAARSEADANRDIQEFKKALRPEVINLINRYYEDSSLTTMSYKEKNGTITPIENSIEHRFMEQYLTTSILQLVNTQLKENPKSFSVEQFNGHLNTTKLMLQRILGVSAKATEAFVHDHLIDIYEKVASATAPEASLFVQSAPGIFQFNGNSDMLNLIRQNSSLLVGYDDGRILRNSDGSINSDATVRVKDQSGKIISINANMVLASGRGLPANTSAKNISVVLFGMRNLLNSYFNVQEEADRIAQQNRRTMEIANNLVARNGRESAQPELFDKMATDSAGRSLGIVNADGSLNFALAGLELPALRVQPKTETVAMDQLQSLLALHQAKNEHIHGADKGTQRPGYFYPSNETFYILKVTQQEAEQYKKDFPNLEFENAGMEGNVLKLKLKNPRNIENIFIGYKIQPQLLKKFSPLLVQDTLVNQFKDAGAHAATAFPVEAVTFYIGIYLNTLMELSINYKDDPAALEKFYAEVTSVPGQLSFFAFMLGNRMFTNLIGPKVNSAVLGRLLPFLGMGVGSVASAATHDVISLTNSCALKLMKADEFDDEAKANAMAECDATYNQVVNSANTHNYITSFMNILVAGGMSAGLTGIIAKSAALTANGIRSGTQAAAVATGNRALVKTAMTLEGIAFEFNLAQQEHKAYSLTKDLMHAGKMTTSARLANWFGYIPNKTGNFMRVGASIGRLGWKIAGGIVIFLAMDKRARPYTYYNEQLLLGSGSDLSMNSGRLRVQLDHLAKNNWSESICQTHVAQNQKNGFKSFYTEHPNDCELITKTETIKKESKLWRDSILYKFMANYSNWLMYVENFQAQWEVTYTFYEELINYAYLAKLAEYDPKKANRYNPLIHDDKFWGVLQTERASQEKNALAPLKTITEDFTFEGMNKLRAQRILDLLPMIGNKRKEITSATFKYKDWKNVEATLSKLSTYLGSYLLHSERKKGDKSEMIKIVKDHFSKKALTAKDLPAHENYSLLIAAIDIINTEFNNYTSAYKSMKQSGPSRDRTPQENQMMYSLYDKAIFFKDLRAFLGKPSPAGRGEAFLRSFEEYLKSTYSEEQIASLSKKTGSAGKDLLWHALCANDLITGANIENKEAQSALVDAKWGKNVKFIYPRIAKVKNSSICNSTDFSKLTPSRGNSENKNTPLDYLIRNLSESVLTNDGSQFETTWSSAVLPRLTEVYKKFDTSYHDLLEEQFVPSFLGKDGRTLLNMNPLEAHKRIQAQPRAKFVGFVPSGNAGGSIVQTYIDEMDSYLRIMSTSFDVALKQDVAIKFASNATQVNKNRYLESSKKRKARFDKLISNFKASFIKVIMSYGSINTDVEAEYASMLLSYVTLLKSVGIVGDLSIDQKNITEDGKTITKVVASVSRNQMADLLLQNYLMTNKTEEIESFVKSQESRYGVSNENTKKAFAEMYLASAIDQSFAGRMRLRLENQPEVRHAFQQTQERVAADNSPENPYKTDRNMSLPALDANMVPQNVPGTLMYVQSRDMIENQFLGLLGASQSLDELMEEVYFNVNILRAASVENKYRDVERARLKKFKSGSMGGN